MLTVVSLVSGKVNVQQLYPVLGIWIYEILNLL